MVQDKGDHIKCPGCGAPMEATASFCSQCGSRRPAPDPRFPKAEQALARLPEEARGKSEQIEAAKESALASVAASPKEAAPVAKRRWKWTIVAITGLVVVATAAVILTGVQHDKAVALRQAEREERWKEAQRQTPEFAAAQGDVALLAHHDAEALRWYRKAAEQGDTSAQRNLGYMYETGRGVERDPAQARDWYRKAADQGDNYAAQALQRLGSAPAR
jgi:TPR repeat protein